LTGSTTIWLYCSDAAFSLFLVLWYITSGTKVAGYFQELQLLGLLGSAFFLVDGADPYGLETMASHQT